ncbi:Serine/threonine protein phosphatase PrpC [Streptomyces sp. DvalAA-14]|uniref:PP2C family serine/threonine-protein phosphatase n=1 Tax=unclassified Streptomyces TaxID=2593676 RepID=UPI00081B8284|nr:MULTISPECIES: protein phosphatase 2C domain-containing protein [unclassified Streptomyces]MYS19688.1 protein phosphatase [Streptomyces sp. SID4948]SCD50667.1 Serine/threonine protein phosphatase PrpC [Streptomyces sp. DvalAA-14]
MPPLPDSAPSPTPAPHPDQLTDQLTDQPTDQLAGRVTVCPHCGEHLGERDLFCESCGLNLSAPPPSRAAAPATSAGPAGPAESGGTAVEPVAGGGPGTDALVLSPPAAATAEADGGDTLVLGVGARLADPRQQEPAAAGTATGPVCVACGVGGVDEDGYCEHCGHAQPRQRDHQEQELEGVAAVSDRGLRHHRNEDAFTVAAASLPDGTPAVAAVVCDGVSTAYRPDDASAAAAAAGSDSLLAALERGATAEDAMRGALLSAFDAVAALAEEESLDGVPHHNAPACTCVSAVVIGSVFTVGWIGDSRAYWIPDDRSLPAARLTEDDSWAARMVAAGLMTEAEAYADERAHAITGWLGADAVEVDPHVAAFQPESPGVVVVCTDGLWNYAESAAELARVIPADARSRPLHSARTLLGVALDGGGHDNVTVAVLPFPAAVSRAGFPPA